MNVERFAQIQRVFGDACRVPPEERDAFVGRACGGDDELADEVRSLLAQRTDEAFLDEESLASSLHAAVAESAPTDEQNDTRCPSIDGYSIDTPIGRGGMGVVYRASQEGTGRTVALKVLRPGCASASAIRRFEDEAIALGRLRHPSIAQIYGAGLQRSRDGSVPYIAMELIEGAPLLRHARDAGLSVRKRVALMAEVCDGIHHAHQKGVVHRDITPSNIMVDTASSGALPKVLDFGIARLSGADAVPTKQTAAGQLIGTVAYMSPEQAAGRAEEIDTRSDVFSLGVVLFELLTDRLPYDADPSNMIAMVDAVRRADPARLRSADPHLDADLETIVGTAIAKEREARYQSASDLAADLRRYLANEPIAARPPTAAYVFRKFARRNRAVVIAGTVMGVSLVGATAVTSWQAWVATEAEQRESAAKRRAELRFGHFRDLARSVVFQLDPMLLDLPGSLPAREFLAQTALEYVTRLEEGIGPGEDLVQYHAELVTAHFHLGDVYGNPLRANLGRHDAALEHYLAGISHVKHITDSVASMGQDDPNILRVTALTHNHLGVLLESMERIDDADRAFQTARESTESLLERFPGNNKLVLDLSFATGKEADRLEMAGRTEDALAAHDRTIELVREAIDNPYAPHELAAALTSRGDALLRTHRLGEARADLDAAAVQATTLAKQEPNNTVYACTLARALERIAMVDLLDDRPDDALENALEAISLCDRAEASEPSFLLAARGAMHAHFRAGEACLALGQRSEALRHLRAAHRTASELTPTRPDAARAGYDLAEASLLLAGALPVSAEHEELTAAASALIDRWEQRWTTIPGTWPERLLMLRARLEELGPVNSPPTRR